METGGLHNPKLGSDSQDSNDHQPSGLTSESSVIKLSTDDPKPGINMSSTPKGVENAKKRLRAFSIQKKSSLSPVSVPKPISSGGATVFIGKLTGVKTQPKNEPDPAAEQKKLPKPPKPGAKQVQDSYISTQKKTLAEIEDMKRKMELVELGIPLGLICPAPNSEKAMPTKAMPPIKSFIDSNGKENAPKSVIVRKPRYIAIHPAIVDELIREAKKARSEGKEFKFDYQKLLPDYDNPFQRKKNNDEEVAETSKPSKPPRPAEHDYRKSRDKDKRRSTLQDKYDTRRHLIHKKGEKDRYRHEKYKAKPKQRDDKYKESEKTKERDARARDRELKTKDSDSKSKDRDLKSKIRDSKSKERDLKKEDVLKDSQKDDNEADVNLQDFVVCDSWSDNEDKSKDSTPKLDEGKKIATEKSPVGATLDPMEQLRESLTKRDKDSPKPKIMKLQPVMDSFKFEIDLEDDVLDIFDENSSIDKFAQLKSKKAKLYDDSPGDRKHYEYDTKDETMDGMADDTFLESVINEIKQEDLDETSQDKGLVEYDESPSKDDEIRDSVTPDMDEKVRELHSSRSDYSDSYKSVESGCKSIESGYKSTDSLKLSEGFKSDSDVEKVGAERKLPKYTLASLETWSFVLKICQPLLFRHDKNKCYKETRMTPKVWFTENPKLCTCVKDRRMVYKELEMCKTALVDRLCSSKQLQEAAHATARGWYPRAGQCLAGSSAVQTCSEWEAEDSQPEQRASAELSLDKEYQRFMEAVWPDVAEPKSETPRSTPVRHEASKKNADDDPEVDKQKAKKIKLSSEGWSQESDVEEADKSYSALQDFLFEAMHYNANPDIANKKLKVEKQKRKRKHSTSTSVTDSSESDAKKRKKMQKKKENKKSKSKEAKKRRVIKKNIKKLKDKQKKIKKKSIKLDEESDVQELEKEKRKKLRKIKKKKQLKQKQKKKNQKKKKARSKSSSSSSSESSSDSESEPEKKAKKKKKNSEKKKKRKKSTSESSQDELFDVNILKNIKTERITDDEKTKQLEFSPRRQKPREIINVKELQNDFVGNSIQIKKEVEMEEQRHVEEDNLEVGLVEKHEEVSQESQSEHVMESENVVESKHVVDSVHVMESAHVVESEHTVESEHVVESDHVLESEHVTESEHVEEKELQSNLKEQEESQSTPQLPPDENNSQCSSQESIFSQKDQPLYEKDESHLRPSSQNSNYSFHDVMASGMYSKSMEHSMEEHDIERHAHDMPLHAHDMQRHAEHDIEMDSETYEQENYDIYEQMAMAYQSDVASQQNSPPHSSVEQRIETVVRARTCGEIKCDWRAGQPAAPRPAPRPSRWGLKPGEVNIVLTGGTDQYPIRNVVEPVYQIQSIANRTDNSATGYDEAYMDMYGAADKLQYGDCFSSGAAAAAAVAPRAGAGAEPAQRRRAAVAPRARSLDERITRALSTTVLGEVAKDTEEDTDDRDGPEKGILVTCSKPVAAAEARGCKRVSFADGYRPGQDSDVEEPPVKKKKKARRAGCAWPCPATHADHVPLWDALPPPPPPPGSPPPPAPRAAPPAHLLRRAAPPPALPPAPHAPLHKFDPNAMPAFMPPEPPPGMITFQNLQC